MKEVFIVSDNILSPLGATTIENFSKLKQGVTSIKKHDNDAISPKPFYASLFAADESFIHADDNLKYTKFEQLLISSISNALQNCSTEPGNKKTILILSSTKGNVSLLEDGKADVKLKERIALHASAKLVADYFNFFAQPVIISNACISGLAAMITGMRLIQSGQYDHAVISGADVISQFIFSGFESFQAISAEPCKPFDANRNGLTLGEGAGTVILSSQKNNAKANIKLSGGAVSNDANHISGPSRTGEELYQAIRNATKQAGISPAEIDFICAHGTATIYNDEMEALAITLADMQSAPVNSLKGYYGHTLGAAGLIECIVSCQSLREDVILPTMGFHNPGVSKSLNISSTLQYGPLTNCLKTASGFGGCNAALVLCKD